MLKTRIDKPFGMTELFSFGFPGLIILIISIYVSTTSIGLEPKIIMFIVSFSFLFIYAKILIMKLQIWEKAKKEYPIELPYSIRVNIGEYKTDQKTLSNEVLRTIKLYQKHFKNAEVLMDEDVTLVKFLPGPLPHPRIENKKVMGFVKVGGSYSEIAFLEQNQIISRTAFAHELGHIIIGRGTGSWENDEHHKFMAKNKLP